MWKDCMGNKGVGEAEEHGGRQRGCREESMGRGREGGIEEGKVIVNEGRGIITEKGGEGRREEEG